MQLGGAGGERRHRLEVQDLSVPHGNADLWLRVFESAELRLRERPLRVRWRDLVLLVRHPKSCGRIPNAPAHSAGGARSGYDDIDSSSSSWLCLYPARLPDSSAGVGKRLLGAVDLHVRRRQLVSFMRSISERAHPSLRHTVRPQRRCGCRVKAGTRAIRSHLEQ